MAVVHTCWFKTLVQKLNELAWTFANRPSFKLLERKWSEMNGSQYLQHPTM